MPPKKAAGPEKKTLLGRPGNNLKIGIVGPFFKPVFYLISLCLSRCPERREVVVFQCAVRDGSVLLLHHPRRPSQSFVDLGKAANFPYATIK
jgi:hypothetical protein